VSGAVVSKRVLFAGALLVLLVVSLLVVALGTGGRAGSGERARASEPTPSAAPTLSPITALPQAPVEWVLVKAGTFEMGSPASEFARGNEETQHRVTLTRDFYIQATEVTQGQFQDVMGYNPSSSTGCGRDCPVEQVSWHEAAAYCNALSSREGLGQCYGCNGSGRDVTCSPSNRYSTPYSCSGYRLPTEAEWEYAARAGTTGPSYGDLSAVAWYSDNSGDTTHRVGQKRANAWGLYDMLGNVWEWCHDWGGDYPGGSVTDPSGPDAGSSRVIRGGSWYSNARNVRAAYRNGNTPGNRNRYFGLRPVRSIP
jgi:formylglycine-generating enzyme required for sulfatase activity